MNAPHTISLDIADVEDRSDVGHEVVTLARLEQLREDVRNQTKRIDAFTAYCRDNPKNYRAASQLHRIHQARYATLAIINDVVA